MSLFFYKSGNSWVLGETSNSFMPTGKYMIEGVSATKVDIIPIDINSRLPMYNATVATEVKKNANGDFYTSVTELLIAVQDFFLKASAIDISLYQTKIDNTLVTIDKTIVGAIGEVKAIALGAQVAFVFDTETALDSWLLIPSNIALLNVGNNLLIRDLSVPDRWWDGTTDLELEVKIDLTNYYTKSELNILFGNKSNITGGNTFVGKQTITVVDGSALEVESDGDAVVEITNPEGGDLYSELTFSTKDSNGVKTKNFGLYASADEISAYSYGLGKSVWTTLGNNFTVDVPTIIGDVTESTGSTSGSLVANGGLGVAKNVAIGGNVGIGSASHSVFKAVIGDATTDDTKLYLGKTDIINNATVQQYTQVIRMGDNTDNTGLLISRNVYGAISIGSGLSSSFGIATTDPYGGNSFDMIMFSTQDQSAVTGRWMMLGTGSNRDMYANKNVGSNADLVIQNNALNASRVVARISGTATQTGDLFDVGVLANSTTFNKKFIIDVNGNTIQNNIINRRETQVTTGSTTTLTKVNARTQEFTGTLNQTVILPVVSGLTINTVYEIVNLSSGVITINSSGGNTIITLASGYTIEVKCIAITGTDVTSWRYGIRNNGAGKSLVSQLESEIPTGTAPLIIASTTKVANLNADLLDDLDSSAFAKVGTGNTFTGNQVINGTTGDTVTINNTGTGNCLVVEGTSEFKNNMTFTGNGTFWEDLNMNPTNLTGGGSAPARVLFGSTNIGIASFSASQLDEVEESVELPHRWKLGSPISFHLHQYPTNTDTGVCRYGLEYFFTEEGVAVTTATTIYLEVAQSGTAWAKKSSSFADIIPPASLGTQFHFRFFRDATHVNDTYTGAIAISTIGIHIESDSLGSNGILTK